MRIPALLLLCSLFNLLRSQDRVYFTDGSAISGRITEVGIEDIKISTDRGEESYSKIYVALIAFQNNTFEHFTDPESEVIVQARDAGSGKPQSLPADNHPRNFLAINTLGLVNADLSFSYERLLFQDKVGFGVFGGYNFNSRVNALFNSFIFQLHNARKLGDAGLSLNYYSNALSERRSFYCGVALKYTPITFSGVQESTVQTGTIVTTLINYQPASGQQLSFLVSCGHHYQISPGFYLRTMGAIGFFRLRGEFGRQYNYINSKNNPSATNIGGLPKLFFALYAGYRF